MPATPNSKIAVSGPWASATSAIGTPTTTTPSTNAGARRERPTNLLPHAAPSRAPARGREPRPPDHVTRAGGAKHAARPAAGRDPPGPRRSHREDAVGQDHRQ